MQTLSSVPAIQKIRMIENASKLTVYSQGNTMMMVSVILKANTMAAIKVKLVALCGYDDTAKIMDLS